MTPELWAALILTAINGLFGWLNLRTRAHTQKDSAAAKQSAQEAKNRGESLNGLIDTLQAVVRQQSDFMTRWDDDRKTGKEDRAAALAERSEWRAELQKNTEASMLRIAAAQQTAAAVGSAREDIARLAAEAVQGRQEVVDKVKTLMNETLQPMDEATKKRFEGIEHKLEDIDRKLDRIITLFTPSTPGPGTAAAPADAPATTPIPVPETTEDIPS